MGSEKPNFKTTKHTNMKYENWKVGDLSISGGMGTQFVGTGASAHKIGINVWSTNLEEHRNCSPAWYDPADIQEAKEMAELIASAPQLAAENAKLRELLGEYHVALAALVYDGNTDKACGTYYRLQEQIQTALKK